MVCSKNGFCSNHQVKCDVHPKVVYYKQDNRVTLRSVSSAIADRLRGAPRSSTVGDLVDVRAVDNIMDVSLLAHGGYNSIWLVKLRAQLEVKCNLPVFRDRQAIAASRRTKLSEHCDFIGRSLEFF